MAQINERGKEFSRLLSLELKGAISAYGFTVKAVVEKVGVDYSTLSRYFKGSRALPATVLNDACEVIGASPDELVQRAYARLIKEMGTYGTTDLKLVSEPSATFDPRDYDLAGGKDTRDEDEDFTD